MAIRAASIELTRRCNLNCSHCTLVHPLADGPTGGELTRRQIMSLVDSFADARIHSVRLHGGEVYLRRDLEDILRHIAHRQLGVVLDTNGTLLTSRRADFLSDVAPERIEMPLFGATAATYESVTRVPGSYAMFRRGVELLLHRRLELRLRGLVGVESREGMAMRDLADHLGVALELERLVVPAAGVAAGMASTVACQAASGAVVQPAR